jgi:cytochrome c peroxidase
MKISKWLLASFVLLNLSCQEDFQHSGSIFGIDDTLSPPFTKPSPGHPDSLAAQVGRKLFFEPRFAYYFFKNSSGDFNHDLKFSDPALASLNAKIRGKTFSCSTCHQSERNFSDSLAKSPLTDRQDGQTQTLRNTLSLAHLSSSNPPTTFNWDGTSSELKTHIAQKIIGREMGWKPNESTLALHYAAEVIRQDENFHFKNSMGKSYRQLIDILPKRFRLNLNTSSDQDVAIWISELIEIYLGSQNPLTSVYDEFLTLNHLPSAPRPGQNLASYNGELLQSIQNLSAPQFIDDARGRFGEEEWQGFKVFVSQSQCIQCHQAPAFSNFNYHVTGVAQANYDSIHGSGQFAKMTIPDLSAREAKKDEFLPPSPNHPVAIGKFASTVKLSLPGYADLGVWNSLGNSDRSVAQNILTSLLCMSFQISCPAQWDLDSALKSSAAAFKTPSLRGLIDSAPYMHDGRLSDLDDVIQFYIEVSDQARAGTLRNADTRLSQIQIGTGDKNNLVLFLKSLSRAD